MLKYFRRSSVKNYYSWLNASARVTDIDWTGLQSLTTLASKTFFEKNNIPVKRDRSDVAFLPDSSLYLFKHAFDALGEIEPKKDVILIPKGHFDLHIPFMKSSGFRAEVVEPTDADQTSTKLTAEKLDKALIGHDGKTRNDIACILFANPTVPTGEIYSKQELEEIGKIALKHNVRIMVDEIFAGTEFKGDHVSLASLKVQSSTNSGEVNLHDHTMTITGGSKTFNLYTPSRMSVVTSGDEDWLSRTKSFIARDPNSRISKGYRIFAESVMEHTSHEYLEANRELCTTRLESLKGGSKYGFNSTPDAGIYSIVEFDKDLFATYGITDNLKLIEYLYIVAGINCGPLSPYCMDTFGVRINHVNDTTADPELTAKGLMHKENKLLNLTFKRFDSLIKQMQSGEAPHYEEVSQYVEQQATRKITGGNFNAGPTVISFSR